MHKIVLKKQLSHDMFWIEFEAPFVAKKAKPGQFIIFRVDEYGERVPITMAGTNKETGTVTLIFQAVGRSTMLLSQLEVGDYIQDVVGPLGKPTHMEGLKKVCVVGGGTGNALAYPVARGLAEAGVKVDMVSGFKTEELIVLKEEFEEAVDNFYLMTDDGSAGEKGFTTTKLEELIKTGNDYDEVITVGPPIMMKFVNEVTKPYGADDRRNRNVRRMSSFHQRRDQVCLRRRTGIRCGSGRLGCTHCPQRILPRRREGRTGSYLPTDRRCKTL